MARPFDLPHGRRAIAERVGAMNQIARIELVTLADGPERGVRLLQARTGGGLDYRIAVDRGFDLLSASYRGVPIGWQSATGPRHPGLHGVDASNGWGFLRSFTGLLATCGLDQALAPSSSSAADYNYPGIDETNYPLHGRASQIPARITGHGERWEGERCVLWAEGIVDQAAVFGEVLRLVRRIESEVGGTTITVRDRVENLGFRPTPHMLLYHYNFGYPLLDEGAEFVVPSRSLIWTTHEPHGQGVGHRLQGPPKADFIEQVYQHEAAAEADGMVPVALINESIGEDGIGLLLDYDSRTLPCLLQWQCLQSGIYVMGIEPSTNHLLGRSFAEERGELQILEHGESRDYLTRLSILDGKEAIGAARKRIEALAPPLPEFGSGSGNWPALRS